MLIWPLGKTWRSLVEDGATIQVGFGGISEATVGFLKDRKDLGVHSEMIPDGILDLAELGVVNGNKKTNDKNKIVCTFIGGTKKIYDWIDNNDMVSMQRAEYTNSPIVASQCHKLTAINSALQVDLFGNIYSDIFGLNDQYTGSGGQLDFAIGACTFTRLQVHHRDAVNRHEGYGFKNRCSPVAGKSQWHTADTDSSKILCGYCGDGIRHCRVKI